MKKKELITSIEVALKEADILKEFSKDYTEDVESAKYVLNLLREVVIKDFENINIRILRAMHDVGMSSYKDFANTKLEGAINKITSILYDEIPGYKDLEPLRMDFGQQNPI
ncbi:hypothetical protein [Mucilaginibacter paludis]|uniref:Uncharacterized protein n=1 Tax=Mucilaginibacter paludis DSM 18603 TaxID=714943 RepID=H1Y8M4_9SPHI|nr:hypothetical protein [Mucilaginibacter paludis]EHQ26896.1 hypothetical protein Mucpa_2784 [Mucilaginibacter paludis DSM 18603]